MRMVGFDGGHSIYELGPVSDVALFFDCLEMQINQANPEGDWSLLTDRLYRRYLRLNELDEASSLMEKARGIFSRIPSKSGVQWDSAILGSDEKTWLNPGQSTLADVFSGYFENFCKACGSVMPFFDAFNIYQPVRLVIADLAGFSRDKNKLLSEYDALEGKSFWLQ